MNIEFKFDGASAVSAIFASRVLMGEISPWWLLLSFVLLFRFPMLALEYWKWSRK